MCPIAKIIDSGSGKRYLAGGPTGGLDTRTITCVDRPAGPEDRERLSGTLVDMESAGFFRAARSFLPPECISLLKVVSDNLSRQIPDEERVLSLIEGNMDLMCDILLEGRS